MRLAIACPYRMDFDEASIPRAPVVPLSTINLSSFIVSIYDLDGFAGSSPPPLVPSSSLLPYQIKCMLGATDMVVAYIRYTFWAKMASFRKAFLGKRFVCCALTMVYSIYNTVGRSIASIYDPGGIFTSGRIYRLWTSLPYNIYNILYNMIV